MDGEKHTYRLTYSFYEHGYRVQRSVTKLTSEELTDKIHELNEDDKILMYQVTKEWKEVRR